MATLPLAYFDLSSQKETLVGTNLQIEKAKITKKEKKKKTEIEVIKPLNVFLFSQKTNFLPNQDKSDIELARRPAEPRSKILPAKLNKKSLGKKSIHWQSRFNLCRSIQIEKTPTKNCCRNRIFNKKSRSKLLI